MKKYILIFTAASSMVLASCSSDYLDTVPNDQISTTTEKQVNNRYGLSIV